MTDTRTRAELAEQLNSARGQLRALELYQEQHGITPPRLAAQRDAVRTLTAALAAHPKDTTMHPNIAVMREHLADVTAELRTLHTTAGNRALNPTEQARWDELTAAADEVQRNLDDAADQEARQARITEARKRWGSLTVGGPSPEPVAPDQVARLDGRQARDAALHSLDRSAGHLTDSQRDHLDGLIRSDGTPNLDPTALNKHIVLTSGEDYRNAFRKITAANVSTIVTLSEREATAVATVQRASMAEGAGATGGFAVPAFLDPTIVVNAQGSANPLRRLARNVTINTKQWKGVGTGGVTWTFTGEGQASTDASPTLTQPTVDIHTARAWVTYSIELQQDAVELDAQLLRILAVGWDDTVAGVLATGSGSGAPKGILTALDAITGSEVQITAPGTLAPGDIGKVWVALPDRARDNASWVMSESVREAIGAWGDEYGNRTVDLGGRLTQLRGRPVYSAEDFPVVATTTASQNVLVVGDFAGYLVVQRAGMTVEPVQTVVNGDGLPTGQRGLFAWARIGADVIDADLLRLLQQ